MNWLNMCLKIFFIRVEDDKVSKILSESARHFVYFKSNLDTFVAFNKFEAFVKVKSLRTLLDVKVSLQQ